MRDSKRWKQAETGLPNGVSKRRSGRYMLSLEFSITTAYIWKVVNDLWQPLFQMNDTWLLECRVSWNEEMRAFKARSLLGSRIIIIGQ